MNPELLLLGAAIRRIRQALQLSQENLAMRAGLNRAYLSDVERGSRNVSYLALLAISRGLGITISDLTQGLGDTSAMTPHSPPRPAPEVCGA